MTEKKRIDLFEHELVPEHILLSKEEVEAVLEKYRIKPHQLPFIKASDPGSKAIKAQPGDVLKIVRKSKTAGEAIAYRYVIEG
ncbi:MAG: DNA-directed polymerase subunit [Thermoproteota archaeon]|nr:DNA-directed polymerase subunit [Thermoproteota archaeon]